MRSNLDLADSLNAASSISSDMPRASYLELARSTGSARTKPTDIVPTLLVEPNTLLREGLRRILSETPYQLLVSAAGLEEARVQAPQDGRSFLVIMDASAAHDDVCAQIREIKDQYEGAHVAILVDRYELPSVLAAFQAGADAYLLKTISCDVLVKTLDLVMLGETVFPSAILELLRNQDPVAEAVHEDDGFMGSDDPDRLPPKGLSVRETVILRCLMDGDSNKIIARRFDITEATVKVHVKAILRKIRAKNRTQAAIWAANHLPAIGRAANS